MQRAAGLEDASIHLGTTPWLSDGDPGAEALARQARHAEALGFQSFWLPEHHFAERGAVPAPLLLLAAVAARTRTLGLGTTSYLLPVRHPLQVAEEVAVLDRLSGGRVILGVGRGFRSAVFLAFGVPAEEKRDRFEAAVALMRDAWSGKPVAWDGGGAAAATPVRLAPLPVQTPHPPLWVAAFGPKGVAQAARLGLPYLASPLEPLDALEANVRRHRAALPEAARAAGLAVPVMRTVFVSEDAGVLARAREGLARQARALTHAPVAAIRRAAQAPLDEHALVGPPEAVAESVARYRQRLGMTHLIVRAAVPGIAPEQAEASLALLAERVVRPASSTPR